MTATNIIDISSDNGDPADWDWVLISENVLALIIKATQGTGYTNPYYSDSAALAESHNIAHVAYHFADFTSASDEAAYFKSVAGSKARILDSETSTNSGWQNAFLVALNLSADEEMDYGSASTLPRSGIRAMLWPASYGKDYGFGDCWQYTDSLSVPGIPVEVDASHWVGSQADFDALFGLTSPTPPPTHVPNRKVPTMFLTTQGNEVFLVSGGVATHVTDPADLSAFASAGIPDIAISAAQFALFTKVGVDTP